MAAAAAFIWSHLTGQPQLPTASLEGCTVIVTGANRGLGIEAALHLARLGPAKLILAVRDSATGDAAHERIKTETAYAGKAEVWTLDLASFASVKSFAARCGALERLDILVENAGIMTLKWGLTEDGWEKTLQVNDLSTGLLGLLTLPVLQKTAGLGPPVAGSTIKPHLTIVGSEVHAWAAFDERKVAGSTLDALNQEEHANIPDRYNVSKLLSLFLARKMSTLATAQDVVVNCVNPGLCKSDFRADLPAAVAWVLNKIAWTAETGAKNLAWAAVEGSTSGAYVSTSKEIPAAPFALSEEGLALETKLWREMSDVWVKAAPEVAEILKA